MPRNANVLVAILSCATASTALACFPAPDAKPTSELDKSADAEAYRQRSLFVRGGP